MSNTDTVTNIINAAASESGLTPLSPGIDPFTSTDSAFLQLIQLFTTVGKELVFMNPFSQLLVTYNKTTLAGDTGAYALPVDFAYMEDQTAWEKTNRNPLGGPMDAQDWQMVISNNTLASIYYSFRIFQGKIQLFPLNPPAGLQLTFEYVSRYWLGVDTTGITKDAPTVGTDVCYIEPLCVIKMLKLRFLEARGFDTTSAAQNFKDVFQMVTGKNIGAPVLSLTRKTLFPYLGDRNVPTTRYGL